MSHHLEAATAYSVDDLRPLFGVGNLELLLKEDRGLLI